MIPLWKGKNPIYFGVIRSKVKVTVTINIIFDNRVVILMSGIPQGSVLGPILFAIYIDDMPECVNASRYLFADDTKIYKEISCEDDVSGLQADLDQFAY
jgi:hypothetical protein